MSLRKDRENSRMDFAKRTPVKVKEHYRRFENVRKIQSLKEHLQPFEEMKNKNGTRRDLNKNIF